MEDYNEYVTKWNEDQLVKKINLYRIQKKYEFILHKLVEIMKTGERICTWTEKELKNLYKLTLSDFIERNLENIMAGSFLICKPTSHFEDFLEYYNLNFNILYEKNLPVLVIER